MTKTLILVRHAHRDTSQRELDNGLDSKGKEQAKAIRRFFIDRFGDPERRGQIWLVSSPKLRCLETLMPLAKALDRPLDTHPDLEEQMSKESAESLQGRVKSFLKEWRSSSADLTVVCSHGDWLPLATQQILGLKPNFKKGAWLEIEANEGISELKWCIPSFKVFYPQK